MYIYIHIYYTGYIYTLWLLLAGAGYIACYWIAIGLLIGIAWTLHYTTCGLVLVRTPAGHLGREAIQLSPPQEQALLANKQKHNSWQLLAKTHY